jgi:hypothetical protein
MKTMKNLFGIMLMLAFCMTVYAQQDSGQTPQAGNDETTQNNQTTQGEQTETTAKEVVVSLNEKYEGGELKVVKKDGQVVTIEVTPSEGYYIEKGDIEVIPVKDPATTRDSEAGESETTMPTGEALELTLVDKDGKPIVDKDNVPVADTEDPTKVRYYHFTVPEGLGAWISQANFSKIGTEGKLVDNVTWKITKPESKAGGIVTLTLAGEGAAVLAEGAATPWGLQEKTITNVVIGAKITSMGDGLLKGCTALTSVVIQNDAAIVALGKEAIPANEKLEVEVPGNLFNEYETTDGWKEFSLTTKGIEMEGVAFEKNRYDTFVSTGKAVMIPSVLNAFVITAIKGNSVVIEEVKDGIIPTDVPVLLLLSKELKSKALYTAESKEAGSVKDCLLKVAGENGKDVKLGEVYLLYNDVFYLSQKGTIRQGGVYLPKPVSRTRSALVIGGENDGTTGIIDAARLIDNGLSGSWYDLSGRKLNGKPTTKGIYIINGKKVVIK